MRASDVEDYLALGFEADPAVASQYLHDLLPGAPEQAEAPSGDLLCRIVEDRTTGAGHHGISLPLTGGLDSRGLLGAALTVLPADAIRCVTFGTADYSDVVDARARCAEVGVTHDRLDPNGITWDLDVLIAAVRRHAADGTGLLPIDGIMVYEALAATLGDDRPVLSGYLGDAASGHELPRDPRARHELEPALDAFFAQNSELADSGRDRDRRDRFAAFVADHAELRDRWPGLTTADLLDLGFRQRRRIRGVASAAYPTGVSPYEDPRWVQAWIAGPVTERLGQTGYRRLLHEAFPAVFPEAASTPPSGRPARRLRRLVPARWKRAMRPQLLVGRRMAARGDPRLNASMRDVLRETTRACDRSGLAPGVAAEAALDALVADPTIETFQITRWTASVGLRLLSQDRSRNGGPAPEDPGSA